MDPSQNHDPDPDDTNLDLFDEPPDYYPPTPPPTTQTYTTLAGDTITLHLVGPHHLWNGARVVAAHFEADPALVRGRTVLELGAGAGLPSIVAAALGARRVVVTDYPDPDLVANMWRNARGARALFPLVSAAAAGSGAVAVADRELPIVAEGLVWGADPGRVLRHLDGYGDGDGEKEKGFDVLVLADLLFRHSEHGNMLRTVRQTLKKSRDSKAFVVFTSYRPWLQHKDLAFFDLAREQGFVVEKVLEKKMDRPLFEKDPGDEEILKTVTGWVLRWPEEVWEGVGS
ncbi:54b29192-0584-4deb-af1c-d8d97aacece5 [Thermothielavioides terrestris]|uniref:Protein N-terminal and lysine N-methyltransferase EFM7 n=1 Tax=Thermothielavioides terrestris TaxID=2587410 RepID=A0A446BWJ4_9PEZI|nr:54b29192-0584-4deb-af1c-d8d97aacece5 [Thermothielavioides terrestris]